MPKIITLGNEGQSNQVYTPLDVANILTDVKGGMTAHATGGNPQSTGWIEFTKEDGTTERVGTLTTDVVNFRYINNVLNMTVRKLVDGRVKEQYTLTASHPTIPAVYTQQAMTDGITMTVSRWPGTGKQTLFFNVPIVPINDLITVDYSAYRFSGAPHIMSGGGVAATLLEGGASKVGIRGSMTTRGFVELTGLY